MSKDKPGGRDTSNDGSNNTGRNSEITRRDPGTASWTRKSPNGATTEVMTSKPAPGKTGGGGSGGGSGGNDR